MKRTILVFSLLILAAGLAACAPTPTNPTIRVEDAWVRPAVVEGGNGAGFLTLINDTGQDDALISADADFADTVEIHQSVMGDNDTMSMVPVDQIDLPRGKTVTLEPGGYHIMLIGIDQTLEPGSTVTIALTFEKAGHFEIPFEVREQ